MAETANGFWIPDLNTPLSLHSILAMMQESTDAKLQAAKTELKAAYPTVGVVSSGNGQSFADSVYTLLTGNANGWVTAINNAAATAAGMSVATGVRDVPITLTQAGTYTFNLHVVHYPDAGQSFDQQCYTDLGISGTLNIFRRINWSWATVASASIKLDIPAGSTLVSLRTFAAASGKVESAELRVWKER